MDMLERIKNLAAAITSNDPLLNNGIARDWVCVIHPSMEYHLRRLPPMEPDKFDRLERMTGRETWILNSAPRDRIEYMPKLEMFKRYADEFAAKARLATMREHEAADDATE